MASAPAVTAPTWRWWEAVGAYLVAIFATAVVVVPVGQALRGGDGEVVVAILADLVVAVGLLVWLAIRHGGWRSSIGFPGRVGREIGAGIGWGIGIYVAVAMIVGGVILQFLQDISGEAVSTPGQVPQHLTAVGQVVLVIRGVAAAPLVEEFFFRAVLFGSLRRRFGFWASAIGSSALFGLVHAYQGSWQGMIGLMSTIAVVGIGLCALYERRGNIVANVVAHATFNTIGLAMIALASQLEGAG